MNDTKKRWTSKTQLAIIIWFIAFLAGQFGIDITSAVQIELVDNLLSIVAGVSFIAAFIGRMVAKRKLR